MINRTHQVARGMRQELTPDQFSQGPWQWGVVYAINQSPATVDLYLDGSTTITPKVRFLDTYFPTLGDTVLVGRYGSDRWVFGPLSSAPSNYIGTWTNDGPPLSGTYGVGAFGFDNTGTVWVCITAGGIGAGAVFVSEQTATSCRVTQSAGFSWSTSTTTCVWTTTNEDTPGGYDNTTGLYTIPSPGLYLVEAAVGVDVGQGWATITVVHNGTGERSAQVINEASGTSGNLNPLITCTVRAVAGDTINLARAASAAWGAQAGTVYNFMHITKLGL